MSRSAHDTLTDERVAIKKVALHDRWTYCRNTLREIRILARLKHENVSISNSKLKLILLIISKAYFIIIDSNTWMITNVIMIVFL